MFRALVKLHYSVKNWFYHFISDILIPKHYKVEPFLGVTVFILLFFFYPRLIQFVLLRASTKFLYYVICQTYL